MMSLGCEGERVDGPPSINAQTENETTFVRAELEAFVSQSVPKYCTRLKALLQNVTACLDGPFTATPNQSDQSLQYGDTTLFDNERSGFKGGFTARKQHVMKANMEIKFKKFNRGLTVKTSVGAVPYIVPQVLNARNLCELALEELEETMSWPQLNFACVSQLAESLSDLLRQTQQEFSYPAKYVFPHSFHSSTVFQPQLPADVVIEFFLRHGRFVVCATGFAQVQQNKAASPQLVHKHSLVEIQEQIECVYAMDELQAAVQLVDSACTICTHLRDQISALRAST